MLKKNEQENVAQNREVSRTQRYKKHYSHRGRGRNAAGTQRTLTHLEV
jgi:hypothetical protein